MSQRPQTSADSRENAALPLWCGIRRFKHLIFIWKMRWERASEETERLFRRPNTQFTEIKDSKVLEMKRIGSEISSRSGSAVRIWFMHQLEGKSWGTTSSFWYKNLIIGPFSPLSKRKYNSNDNIERIVQSKMKIFSKWKGLQVFYIKVFASFCQRRKWLKFHILSELFNKLTISDQSSQLMKANVIMKTLLACLDKNPEVLIWWTNLSLSLPIFHIHKERRTVFSMNSSSHLSENTEIRVLRKHTGELKTTSEGCEREREVCVLRWSPGWRGLRG